MVSLIYLSETSEDKIRGLLCSLTSTSIFLGKLPKKYRRRILDWETHLFSFFCQNNASGLVQTSITHYYFFLFLGGGWTVFLGLWLKYYSVLLINSLFPLGILIGFLFLPESPRYLAIKGNVQALL